MRKLHKTFGQNTSVMKQKFYLSCFCLQSYADWQVYFPNLSLSSSSCLLFQMQNFEKSTINYFFRLGDLLVISSACWNSFTGVTRLPSTGIGRLHFFGVTCRSAKGPTNRTKQDTRYICETQR